MPHESNWSDEVAEALNDRHENQRALLTALQERLPKESDFVFDDFPVTAYRGNDGEGGDVPPFLNREDTLLVLPGALADIRTRSELLELFPDLAWTGPDSDVAAVITAIETMEETVVVDAEMVWQEQEDFDNAMETDDSEPADLEAPEPGSAADLLARLPDVPEAEPMP